VNHLRLEAAVPVLIGSLNDPDDEVQYAAVEALGTLHARQAVPRLLPFLKHQKGVHVKRYHELCFVPSSWLNIECAAAKALVAIGDPAAIAEAKRIVPHCLPAPKEPASTAPRP
jgi:HEAT repeat protein